MVRLENVREMSKRNGPRRFLIGRAWPKGVVRFIPHREESGAKKTSLAEMKWCPRLAPLPRTWEWFQAHPEKIGLFRTRYFGELQRQRKHWLPIVRESRKRDVTLLFDPRDSPWTPAHFFKEFIDLQLRPDKSRRLGRAKHIVQPGEGVAVPAEKAISRKSERPLKEEMRLQPEQKLTFVSPEKRRVLR